MSDLEDADTKRLTKGVQRVELSERLERCFAKGYEINVRPLLKPLTDEMVRTLNEFRHEVSGRPYEKNTIELLIELTSDEMEPFVKQAAERVSLTRTPKGFRPGKAPVDVMARTVGMDVLRHRVAITYEAEAEEKTSETIIQKIFDELPVP